MSAQSTAAASRQGGTQKRIQTLNGAAGLLDHQAKLNEARSRYSNRDLTEKQLDDRDADLEASASCPVWQEYA